jgi:membrane-anchored protein YejM (alkaline phosphatase superfamily)
LPKVYDFHKNNATFDYNWSSSNTNHPFTLFQMENMN